MSSSDESSDHEDTTTRNPEVATKYRVAGKIADNVLKAVLAQCLPGKLVRELCEFGDASINEQTSKVYTKNDKKESKIERGVAFPTCVNINNIICHFSPLHDDATVIQEGDVVRVDLGVHIDGYIASAAHTIVVQTTPEPIKGKLADTFAAASKCMDAAHRLVAKGKQNQGVTDALAKICQSYGVSIVDAVLSHQVKRYLIDGNECILSKTNPEQKVDNHVFEDGEVWTLDIVVSTGQGKLREEESRTFVYKRAPDQQYLLKLRASQQAIKEIDSKFQTFPFTIRSLDQKSGRLGVSECLKHGLVIPYPVLYERQGDTCVQIKHTIIIGTASPLVSGIPLTQEFSSELTIEDPEILEILSKSEKKRRKKGKSKKKAAGTGTAGADEKSDDEGEEEEEEKKTEAAPKSKPKPKGKK